MKKHEDIGLKYIKTFRDSIIFIIVTCILGSLIVSMVNSDVEIEFKCDSGFIGIDIEKGDIENWTLKNIENMNCEVKFKGPVYSLTRLGR